MICVFNLSSSVDKMLRNSTKPPYEKAIVEDNNPIPLFLLGAHAHPLLSFLIKDFSDGGKNSRQKLFSKKIFWCPYNNYELISYIESPIKKAENFRRDPYMKTEPREANATCDKQFIK